MRFGSKVDGTNVGYSGAANGAKRAGGGMKKRRETRVQDADKNSSSLSDVDALSKPLSAPLSLV
jgi:hypothetical protein